MSSTKALKNQMKALEDSQRDAFFAARPYLPQYLRDALKNEPMHRVHAVVNAWSGEQAHGDPELARVDAAMGLAGGSTAVIHTEFQTILGAPRPA